MIDRLRGLIHPSPVNIRGFYDDRYNNEVYYPRPSHELAAELRALPVNSRVAIDYSPQCSRPFIVRGKIVIPPLQYKYYWQQVEAECRESGHKIIHFENPALVREEVRLQLEYNRLMRMLGNAPSEDEEQKLRNDLYGVRVESGYIEGILRDTEILNMIKNTQPDAAVFRRNSTEVLLLSEDETRRRIKEGMDIGKGTSTHRLQVIPFEKGRSYHLLSTGVTFEDYEASNLVKVCTLRKYKAIKEGRVTDGKPALIGTWDTQTPARGLFEIYPEQVGDGFCGVIEDTLGTAMFQGSLDDIQITFTKTYIPEKSLDITPRVPIFYHGVRTGDEFRGEYKIPAFDHSFVTRDKFVIRRFNRTDRSTK